MTPLAPSPDRLPVTARGALRAARRRAPRLVRRVFTVLCAAVGVVLGLAGYAVALGLGAGLSAGGVLLAVVIGGAAFALASRTLLARTLAVRALWLVARVVVRRVIPI